MLDIWISAWGKVKYRSVYYHGFIWSLLMLCRVEGDGENFKIHGVKGDFNFLYLVMHKNQMSFPTSLIRSVIFSLCSAAVRVLLNWPLTHNEAAVPTITAVVQAAVGLEQEEAAGSVVVIGGDARHPQTLPLSQQLFFPREASVVRAGLRSGVTREHTTWQWPKSRSKKVVHAVEKQKHTNKTWPNF